ncbi:hypothetical protein GCM10023331_37060 [Algivirga pacifica]|uniref:Uncharacterized protein n=1 Tax=Algivirga pacifica TaxID=1162670 RepID=A0ABP9DJF8_9BACT
MPRSLELVWNTDLDKKIDLKDLRNRARFSIERYRNLKRDPKASVTEFVTLTIFNY